MATGLGEKLTAMQEFAVSAGCAPNIHKPLEMETNQSLLHNKSGNGLINNLKASKNTITDLNLGQDGDFTFPPKRRIHLRHRTGSRTATCGQLGAGLRGNNHPGLNSEFFLFFVPEMSFRLPEI